MKYLKWIGLVLMPFVVLFLSVGIAILLLPYWEADSVGISNLLAGIVMLCGIGSIGCAVMAWRDANREDKGITK